MHDKSHSSNQQQIHNQQSTINSLRQPYTHNITKRQPIIINSTDSQTCSIHILYQLQKHIHVTILGYNVNKSFQPWSLMTRCIMFLVRQRSSQASCRGGRTTAFILPLSSKWRDMYGSVCQFTTLPGLLLLPHTCLDQPSAK